MTWKPEDIVVSDAEVEAHIKSVHGDSFIPSQSFIERTRRSLQERIAARMPPQMHCPPSPFHPERIASHNAELDAVARGRG